MELNTFQAKVAELQNRKPIWFGLESDPPASASELSVAESSLGVTLPSSYRDFVREFGGGYFAFGNVFSVKSESSWNIVDRNESIAMPDFVSVSDNGTGDYYGFKVVDGKCDDRVYLWDHEEPDSLKATDYADFFEFLDSVALTPS